MAEIMKQLAQMWSECTDEDRREYEEYAECDRKCYNVEMNKYKRKAQKK